MRKLFKKFQEISNLTWKELQNRPKQTSIELLKLKY